MRMILLQVTDNVRSLERPAKKTSKNAVQTQTQEGTTPPGSSNLRVQSAPGKSSANTSKVSTT